MPKKGYKVITVKEEVYDRLLAYTKSLPKDSMGYKHSLAKTASYLLDGTLRKKGF